VRSENKSITIAFMCGLILADGYFGFKIYRIYTKPEKYQYTKKYLTFFGMFYLMFVAYIGLLFCVRVFQQLH
ncbi:hypothetical protein HDU99_008995, partial [Rhizoclosmatium hyalinum]